MPSSASSRPTRVEVRGQSFAAEARFLYAVLTCSLGVPPPGQLSTKIVASYCRRVRPALLRQRDHARRRVGPYLAKLRPKALPGRVVYPFGGADLVTALTTFPKSSEITTFSLEHAGDPRPLFALRGRALRGALDAMGPRLAAFFGPTTSKSTTLMKMQRGAIPGELAFFMGALAVHGYRPVDLRYFRVEADGTLHYYTREEIVALGGHRARKLAQGWTAPQYSPAFSNSELVFERVDGRGPRHVHRHIAANLADDALKKRPGLLRHLAAKGKVAVMTKAASYLLWRSSFSRIRRYLVKHLAWMISDSTGIPPRVARAAGLGQKTYGRYRRCFFARFDRRINADFVALWRRQPHRTLGFRYGYPDGRGAYHLMVTWPVGRD
ncbi:MAG: hypothetical protein KAI47_17780 [Deltaproteobacteria bacterium]|nr:hypothetical protein [Deltaproteobacteria bacterium]